MHFLALAVRVRGHCYRLNGMSLSDSVFKQALASPAAKTMIETGPTGRAGHRNQQIRLFVDDATIPGDALVRAVTLLFWSEPDMHVALILAARKSANSEKICTSPSSARGINSVPILERSNRLSKNRDAASANTKAFVIQRLNQQCRITTLQAVRHGAFAAPNNLPPTPRLPGRPSSAIS